VIGRNCRFLQSPQTSEETRAEIRRALAARREVNVTILNQRKDGTPFWNELFIAPVFDDSGQLTHFVGVLSDITERKQSEERNNFLAIASSRLSESLDYHETLESIAELAVPQVADWCAIDLVGENGDVTRIVHPAETIFDAGTPWVYQSDGDAVSAAQPVSMDRTNLVTRVTDANIRSIAGSDAAAERLRAWEILSFITVPMIARGKTLGALTFATSVRSGRQYGAADLLLAEDLARRAATAIDNAQLYNEAQAAVRARDQFLSIAAHELRTPVSSIKGYAQMLLRGYQKGTMSPERLARSLVTIDRATERLAVLTSDLLDVSRIRLGQLPLRPQEIELGSLVSDIASRYADTYRDQHPIEVVVSGDPFPAIADPDRLDQVLANLIDNAAKYSPGGGTITVTVERANHGALVTVKDEGIGLPEESLEAIFEPFGRATNAIERSLPGLGLGLYICRGIIERHGGRIWAESAGDGCGTRMRFTVPEKGYGPDLADEEFGSTLVAKEIPAHPVSRSSN
jgi:signal transduction histidine kinase